MALVKCKQCGNEVATNAAACPKCGAPVPKGMSVTKVLLFVFGGLFSLCFLGTCITGMGAAMRAKGGGSASAAQGSGSATTAVAAQKEAAQKVEIRTLLREYADNEVRADSNFKDHMIQTVGIVGDVKKDITNSIYVTLGTGKEFEIPQVQCFFDDAQAQKAATLSKGAKVGVRGRVSGLMMNVLVKDCEFIDL